MSLILYIKMKYNSSKSDKYCTYLHEEEEEELSSLGQRQKLVAEDV